MTKQFRSDLDALKGRVAAMSELARASVLEGVRSFADLDVDLADRVIARDAQLNRLDVEIERDALELIALNQPMAGDLRTLGATLKIITYLDRIGRYGYDIAHATRAMAGREHVRRLVTIPHMAEIAVGMVEEAVAAFVTRDADRARAVPPRDDLVDALNEQLFRESLTFAVEEPRAITAVAYYLLVGRHLERVGDNANKIAEKALYMVTGERRLDL